MFYSPEQLAEIANNLDGMSEDVELKREYFANTFGVDSATFNACMTCLWHLEQMRDKLREVSKHMERYPALYKPLNPNVPLNDKE